MDSFEIIEMTPELPYFMIVRIDRTRKEKKSMFVIKIKFFLRFYYINFFFLTLKFFNYY